MRNVSLAGSLESPEGCSTFGSSVIASRHVNFKKLPLWYFKSLSQFTNGKQTYVSHAIFNFSYVCSVNATTITQLTLRKESVNASSPYSLADRDEKFVIIPLLMFAHREQKVLKQGFCSCTEGTLVWNPVIIVTNREYLLGLQD